MASIKLYLDVVSPYSFLGFETALRYVKSGAWQGNLELVPFFLGGIMQGAGNKPPATVPAKGKYLVRDVMRWRDQWGLPDIKYPAPSHFPANTIKAQRALTVLKEKYGGDVKSGSKEEGKLEQAFRAIWLAYYGKDQDISKEEVVIEALAPIIGKDEAIKLMKEDINAASVKEALTAVTGEALQSGAFGAPWWKVTRSDGKTEYFFGNDRMEHICSFLGVPYQGAYPNGFGKNTPSRL